MFPKAPSHSSPVETTWRQQDVVIAPRFADIILNSSNSRLLSIESVEDPMDLKPMAGRLDIGWLPTAHVCRSTFAVLPMGDARLLGFALPPSLVEGRVGTSRAAVWFAIDTPHRAVVNGTSLPEDALLFGGPGARCQAYWPTVPHPPQSGVAVTLPWTLVPKGWPEPESLCSIHRVEPSGLGELRRLIRETFTRAGTRPKDLADAGVREALGAEMIGRLTDLFATGTGDVDPQAALKRRYVEILDRIDELIASRLDRPLLLDEVAAELRLAPRSIHNVMKLLRGMTLQTHVKIFKLRSIRQRLLRDESCDLVKQVAFMHGYTHLGRLAQEYTKFFGESPSATLARKRR